MKKSIFSFVVSIAFPTHICKLLQNPVLNCRLEKEADNSGWTLSQMENGVKGCAFDLNSKNGSL